MRPHPRRGRVVLILEDGDAQRSALGEIVGRAGYDVHAAATPLAALSLSKSLPRIDAAVVDAMTQGGKPGGLDFVRALRRDPGTEKLPVILTTALSIKDLNELVRPEDAVTIVRKPFDVDDLLGVLAMLTDGT